MFSSQADWSAYRLPSCLLNGLLGLLMDTMNIHDVCRLAALKHANG